MKALLTRAQPVIKHLQHKQLKKNVKAGWGFVGIAQKHCILEATLEILIVFWDRYFVTRGQAWLRDSVICANGQSAI